MEPICKICNKKLSVLAGYTYLVCLECSEVTDCNGWIKMTKQLPLIGQKIISFRDLTEKTIEEIEIVTDQFLKYYEMNDITHWKLYNSNPPIK